MSDMKKVEDLKKIDLHNIHPNDSIFFIPNQGYCFVTKTHVFTSSINRKKYPVKRLKLPNHCDTVFFQNIRKKNSSELMLDIVTQGSEYVFLKYLHKENFKPEFFSCKSKMMKILKYQDWSYDMHAITGNSFAAIFTETEDSEGNINLELIRYYYSYQCNFIGFKNKIESFILEFNK